MPTMIFVLTGSEHCIADSFYYCLAQWNWMRALQIFEVFIGNFIGATLITLCSSDNWHRPLQKDMEYPHWWA